MVSTSPAPMRWSLSVVRVELTRTGPDSISFCASVRDLRAREKNSHLWSRCFCRASSLMRGGHRTGDEESKRRQEAHFVPPLLRFAVAQHGERREGRIGVERRFALRTIARLGSERERPGVRLVLPARAALGASAVAAVPAVVARAPVL